MNNNKNSKLNGIEKQENNTEMGEDTTKYGEFVCSYFAWISLDRQKENVKRMENMTKEK